MFLFFRCEFERLQSTFMNTDDFYVAEGLIYLKYIHNVVKKQIYSSVRDDIPRDNLVYRKLIEVIRYYIENHELDKQFFYRFPPNKLKKIELVRQFVTKVVYTIIIN